MKFKEIEVENFRNFYGSHKLKFSEDVNKPVTLLLVNNGFGKTSILNSIYWCLFGKSLGDFDLLKALNTRAMQENNNTMSVRLVFEDEGHNYEIKRLATFTFQAKKTTLDDKFSMIRIEKSGASTPIVSEVALNQAQRIINKALPESMATLFIFEGEGRANQFLSPTNAGVVARDLRRVIGAEEVSTLIDDLGDIVRSSERSVSENNANADLAGLAKLLSKNEEREIELNLEKQNWIDESTRKKARIEELSAIIFGNADAEQIEADRNRYLKDIDDTKSNLILNKSKKIKWIREKAISVIAESAVTEAQDVVDPEKLHGKLPGDYQESFVKRLIDKGECICGTKIEKDSPEHLKLNLCMHKGDNSAQIQSALQSNAAITVFLNSYNSYLQDLTDLESEEFRLEGALTSLEIDLENAKRRLENVAVETIKNANQERKGLQMRVDQLTSLISLQNKTIDDQRAARTVLEEKITLLAKKAPEIQKVLKENEEVKNLIEISKKWLEEHENKARSEIARMINENLAMLGQGFEAFFDKDLNLSTKQKSTGVEIQKNSGTGQLLAISFIAALIKFCDDRKNSGSPILTSGTTAPMVLDAPFGVLDEGVRNIVARQIPQLAQQVVILVSDTQSSVFKETSLRNAVGATYAIVHQTPESDLKRQYFEFPGQRIEVTRSGTAENYFFEEIKI